MSNWKLIVPVATRNMVLNPSAELAGNYAEEGGPVSLSRYVGGVFGRQFYGLSTDGDNEGMTLTLAALANLDHYVSMYVEVITLTADWDWSLDNATYREPELLMQIDDDWAIYGAAFVSTECVGETKLYIRQKGAGLVAVRIDGIQVEPLTYWTTFCDGDQEDCVWDGTPHASTSRRSSLTRAGGRVRDLEDDYSFKVHGMNGPGTVPHTLRVDEFAGMPGGELTSDKIPPRKFQLVGAIDEDNWTDFHNTRSDLVAALSPQAYPPTVRGPQELRLWYTGAPVVKEISAAFEQGLPLRLAAGRDPNFSELRVGLQFKAPDPLWYEIGNTSLGLDVNDALAVKLVAGKIFSAGAHGLWDNMSVGATTNPTAVYAIAIGPDGKIYVGGDFDLMDGVANTLNIACYDPLADTWSALGSGLNSTVRALVFGPDGTLYAGGAFTDAGADGDADRLAQWNGTAWSAVGGAGTREDGVFAICFDADGNLIIGGSWDATPGWMDDGDAAYIAIWDGTNWGHLDADHLNGFVYALALAPNGDVFIGGTFTTKENAAAAYLNQVCYWDGTDFLPLGTADNNGLSSYVNAIAIDRSGQVYIGGDFLTAMKETVNYITKWNHTMFEALGGGAAERIECLAFGPDDTLWLGGGFTTMADLGWIRELARWKNGSWASVDILLPGEPTVHAITLGAADPVLEANYDVWLGFDTEGDAYTAGDATATYATLTGGWLSYPKLIFERSGGTSARLLSIKNTSTGFELNLDYALQDGERLTIDLTPTKKSIVSSFYGEVPGALLPNSDFGNFSLLSRTTADGYLLSFVDLVGGNSITPWLEHRKAYESID